MMNVSNDQSKSKYRLQWRLGYTQWAFDHFCLSREGKQEIRPMCEWDGYVCAKWRKFLRNKKTKEKDIKSFAQLSKKCEELKTYNVGDFNTPNCCLITFTVNQL